MTGNLRCLKLLPQEVASEETLPHMLRGNKSLLEQYGAMHFQKCLQINTALRQIVNMLITQETSLMTNNIPLYSVCMK